ncbi:MAG: LCP family protein [Clostridium sp.]|uniref:LCP family protein n=1 Tax=Clostridium sp. TaxID=1506 RepID=UPI003EE61766
MIGDKDNRGKRLERKLSKEEELARKKRIAKRNDNMRKGQRKIPINDPRRKVNYVTDEEKVKREFERQRRIYEENLDEDLFLGEDENFFEEEKRNRSTRNGENNRNDGKAAPRNRNEGNKSTTKKKVKKSKTIKAKKKSNGNKIKVKTILKIIGVILLLFITFNIFSVMKTISKISTTDMIAPKVVSMDSTVNILLLGMDVGNVKDPNDNSLKRTDTIMVLNFNPSTKKVKVVSIPRDTMIDINGRRWKINAAYPVGGEEEIVKQVEKLLQINVNYVANVNYTAFRDFIDAIGGVTVKIKYDMDYTDKSQNLRIKFKKGTTEHLDGKKAEEFFRWRKNNDGTGLAMGDLGRIENQHEFMQAVVKKCTSPMIILKIPDILKVIEKNVKTNMSGTRMLRYALKLISVKDFEMTMVKGTPQTIAGQSYYVFSEEKNKALIQSLKQGAEEPQKGNTSSGKVLKGNIKVKIVNTTTKAGLAANYKTTLDREGFKTVDIGSVENNVAKKTYALVKNKEIEKEVKKDLVGISEYKIMGGNSPYKDYDLVIMLGLDTN